MLFANSSLFTKLFGKPCAAFSSYVAGDLNLITVLAPLADHAGSVRAENSTWRMGHISGHQSKHLRIGLFVRKLSRNNGINLPRFSQIEIRTQHIKQEVHVWQTSLLVLDGHAMTYLRTKFALFEVF